VPYQPRWGEEVRAAGDLGGSSVAAISHEPSAVLLAVVAKLTCSISVR
jgi:hypothetical protein